MHRNHLTTLALALTAISIPTATTHADFVGLSAEIVTTPAAHANDLWTVDVYAVFDDPGDTLMAVSASELTATCCPFVHAPGFPESWLPLPAVLDPEWDSFVTIGLDVADGNATSLNPAFQGQFCSLNAGAAWFNGNPPNEQGRAGNYPGLKVLVARLTTPSCCTSGAWPEIFGELTLTYFTGGTTGVDTDDFSIAHPNPCGFCEADLNGDGIVDGQDLGMLLGDWGPCNGCPSDLNNDGVVDGADLGMLLAAWGICFPV